MNYGIILCFWNLVHAFWHQRSASNNTNLGFEFYTSAHGNTYSISMETEQPQKYSLDRFLIGLNLYGAEKFAFQWPKQTRWLLGPLTSQCPGQPSRYWMTRPKSVTCESPNCMDHKMLGYRFYNPVRCYFAYMVVKIMTHQTIWSKHQQHKVIQLGCSFGTGSHAIVSA